MQDTEKPCPKFKKGQIVVMKCANKPFKILDVKWNDSWFYQWNRRNWASESMLRELTDEEK